MLTQISIKEGIKKIGDKRSDAQLKEINQLHEHNALLPIRKEDMISRNEGKHSDS